MFRDDFIENTPEQFAADFGDIVKNNPARFIDFMLEVTNTKGILNCYIDKFFSALDSYKIDRKYVKDKIELLIKKYRYDYDSYRAKSICWIISKNCDMNWSEEIISMVFDIALHHNNPNLNEVYTSNGNDKECRTVEMLSIDEINCTRSVAVYTIARLIHKNYKLFNDYKTYITNFFNDDNPIIRYACVNILYFIGNQDIDFVNQQLMKLIKSDLRVMGHRYTRYLLYQLFLYDKTFTKQAFENCCLSEDKELIKVAFYSMTEAYLHFDEFYDVLVDKNNTKEEIGYITEMIILYFKIKEYSKKAKQLIIDIYKNGLFSSSIRRIFHEENLLSIEEDKDFLLNICTVCNDSYFIREFIEFINKQINIIFYADFITEVIGDFIKNYDSSKNNDYFLAEEMTRLIATIYDESTKNIKYSNITQKCLDLWDLMYEKNIGYIDKITMDIINK